MMLLHLCQTPRHQKFKCLCRVAVQQEQQPGLDFIRQVITDDIAAGRTQQGGNTFST